MFIPRFQFELIFHFFMIFLLSINHSKVKVTRGYNAPIIFCISEARYPKG